MKATILVCTYGSDKWAGQGLYAAYRARGQSAFDVVAIHDADATLSQIRNAAGAAAVASDWLCFLDADDELAPGYMDAMRRAWYARIHGDSIVSTASGPRPTRVGPPAAPALLVPAVRYVRPDGRHEEATIPNADPPRPLWEISRAVIGTLVRRDVFLRAGGFPEEPCYEDWALWLKCHYDLGVELVHVPDAVYVAHVRDGSRNTGDSCGEVYWRYRCLYEGRV